MYGYAVVRPQNDKWHDIFLRVWLGRINSVVILPRSDNALPRQGQVKSEILEQMELVPGDKINDYNVWLERMKKVAGSP